MLFRIKVVTNTNKNSTYQSYTIQKKGLIFWHTATNGDLGKNSYSSHIHHFSNEEKAREGIETWKKQLASTTKKIKVLSVISV